MAHGLTPAPMPFSLYHIAGTKYLSPFTDPFTGKMLVLEEEPALGTPSLSKGPCPQAQASPHPTPPHPTPAAGCVHLQPQVSPLTCVSCFPALP